MNIKIAEIDDQPLRIKGEETGKSLAWDLPEFPLADPVTVELTLVKTDGLIQAWGTAGTTIHLLCSRCVEIFPFQIKARIDLEYVPGREASLPREAAIDDEMIRRVYFRGLVIDFNEDIRQGLMLEIPIRPLCSKDCLGLCAVCKGNLTRKECRCKK